MTPKLVLVGILSLNPLFAAAPIYAQGADDAKKATDTAQDAAKTVKDAKDAVDGAKESASEFDVTPQEPAKKKVPVYDDPNEMLPDAKERAHGLLGKWRVGPTFQLSVPHPISYGLDLLYDGRFGVGFATGKYSTSISSSGIDVDLQLTHWDLRFRWLPWAKNFFLGLGYGSQTLYATAADTLEFSGSGFNFAVPVVGEVEVTTAYLLPHIGWFAMWDSGFTLGFELGVQVPMGNDLNYDFGFSTVTASQFEQIKQQEDYKKLDKEIKDIGDLIGKTILPHITLIRLGWLF